MDDEGMTVTDHKHPQAPEPLPPDEHDKAVALEEAQRLERLKATKGSHRTAGSAELPKVRSEDTGS